MSKLQIIHILGASGAGTSTLGQTFEREYGFKWFDTDGFFWQQDDPPFTNILPHEKRIKLLAVAIKEYPKCVISGPLCGWGDIFIPDFGLVVYVDTPTEIRIERLKKRESERFGDRIRKGGDMFDNHRDFLEWAEKYDDGGMDMRSRAMHEEWLKGCPCPIVRIDGTTNCGQTAADIMERFYTKPGEPWRVYTAALGELKTYRFTVIFARYNGKWLYARHKDRDTYETAGGHIETSETPLDCAKRELYEETGATKFSIFPAFDYAVHTDTEFSYGQVFYADLQTIGELPDSEMAEVRAFTAIPDKLTYPMILPVLYNEMDRWLGRDNVKDEYWDVLDENRNITGRKHRRIDDMPPGDYHLVVRAWIINSKGEFLITRRAFNKIGFPGMWEVPKGSATAGEESLESTVREAKEESGIVLSNETAKLFSTYRRGNSFYDNWLFRQDFDLTDVVLQEGETIDARAATWNEIADMMNRGEFIGRDVFPEFDLLEGLV